MSPGFSLSSQSLNLLRQKMFNPWWRDLYKSQPGGYIGNLFWVGDPLLVNGILHCTYKPTSKDPSAGQLTLKEGHPELQKILNFNFLISTLLCAVTLKSPQCARQSCKGEEESLSHVSSQCHANC